MREEGVGCSRFPFFSLHPLSLQRPRVCRPSVLSILPIPVVFLLSVLFFFYGKVEADRGRVQCSHILIKTNDERYGQEITAPTALKIFKSVAKIEC